MCALVLGLCGCSIERPSDLDRRLGPSDSGGVVPTPTETPAAPTNLMLVIADDLGLERLATYDFPLQTRRAVTPVLDGLAADGMVFENAYSAPTCSPARAALLTGLVPRDSGVAKAYDVGEPRLLDPALDTLPELLRERGGYATSWAGKWHLAGFVADCEHPVVTGFDWYAGSIFNFTETGVTLNNPNYWNWDKCAEGSPVRSTVRPGSWCTSAASACSPVRRSTRRSRSSGDAKLSGR